jgi:hypothetical protein
LKGEQILKSIAALVMLSVSSIAFTAQLPVKELKVDGYDAKGYPVLGQPTVNVSLSSGQYGRKKIVQWGDPLTPPQSRTRCVSEAWGKWPWGGEWRTCNGWATDYRTMQVELYMKGVGPVDLVDAVRSAVENIVATCVGISSAIAVSALWGAPSPEPATRIAAAYAGASATFTGCISGKAAELTAVGVTAASIQLAFDHSAGWSSWSNE